MTDEKKIRPACRAQAPGRAAKLAPGDLQQLLAGIDFPDDERFIVGEALAESEGRIVIR